MTRRVRGYSHLEVLIAVVVLGLVLVPALESLRAGIDSSRAVGTEGSVATSVASRVEELLALPFSTLQAQAGDAGTVHVGWSDPAGTIDRRLVFLARYDPTDSDGDGDPFTGADGGLLWLAVQAEGRTARLETLVGP